MRTHPDNRLDNTETSQFGNVSQRLPSLDGPYLYFEAHKDGSFGYYSHWIGFDKEGREVRVGSPLDATRAIEFREFLPHPVYVVESNREWIDWQYRWRAGALLPEALARERFQSFFERKSLAVKDPPMDKVAGRGKAPRERPGKALFRARAPRALSPGRANQLSYRAERAY